MFGNYLDTSTMPAEVYVRRTWGGVVVTIISNTGARTAPTAAEFGQEVIVIEFADARAHRQRQGEELAAKLREMAERMPQPIQPRVFRKPRVPYPEATVPPLARPVLASRFTEAQARRGCRGR